MYKKKVLLPFFIVILFCNVFSANNSNKKDSLNTKNDKIKAAFSGFFKYDLWYDTRQMAESVDGLFAMYPKNKLLDANGNDINHTSSMNAITVTTRVRTIISGPEILKARSSVLIEGDFSTNTSTKSVRFRHAIAKLNWDHTELIIGRYWHPLFVAEVCPRVMSLNTGVPFQVFNRSPQIRIKQTIGNFNIISAFLYQADYKSTGPEGRSSTYMRNAKIPNMHLQLQYKYANMLTAGIAGDYKVLKPSIFATSLVDPGTIYKTNETIGSYTFMAYFKYMNKKITFKTKGMLGQNLYEHLLPGGYAVSNIDSLTGEREYTPYNNFYYWINLLYGKKLKGGIFGGYMKNLGTSNEIVGDIYARGADIDAIYRISPHIAYQAKNMQFSLELEHTNVRYGTINYEDGTVEKTEDVDGRRLLFTVFYFF